jgi:hypothetical protein
MDNLKSTLDNIFNIIGYTGNKDQLCNQLMNICYLSALDELTEALSEADKESIKKELANITDLTAIEEIANRHFNQQQLDDALQKSSEKVFRDYIGTIKDSLTEAQINKLKEFAVSLKPQVSL